MLSPSCIVKWKRGFRCSIWWSTRWGSQLSSSRLGRSLTGRQRNSLPNGAQTLVRRLFREFLKIPLSRPLRLFRELSLRTPRPAAGVSRALRPSPRKPGCPRECPTERLRGPSGPGARSVQQKCPESVSGVLKKCPPDTLWTLRTGGLKVPETLWARETPVAGRGGSQAFPKKGQIVL